MNEASTNNTRNPFLKLLRFSIVVSVENPNHQIRQNDRRRWGNPNYLPRHILLLFIYTISLNCKRIFKGIFSANFVLIKYNLKHKSFNMIRILWLYLYYIIPFRKSLLLIWLIKQRYKPVGGVYELSQRRGPKN